MIFPQIYRDSLWRSEELSTRLGLQISALEADHISLRCHQNTTAGVGVAVLNNAASYCRKISSTAGRCLFKLHEPVCVEHWRFSVIELPWPGKRYPHEGWGAY